MAHEKRILGVDLASGDSYSVIVESTPTGTPSRLFKMWEDAVGKAVGDAMKYQKLESAAREMRVRHTIPISGSLKKLAEATSKFIIDKMRISSLMNPGQQMMLEPKIHEIGGEKTFLPGRLKFNNGSEMRFTSAPLDVIRGQSLNFLEIDNADRHQQTQTHPRQTPRKAEQGR